MHARGDQAAAALGIEVSVLLEAFSVLLEVFVWCQVCLNQKVRDALVLITSHLSRVCLPSWLDCIPRPPLMGHLYSRGLLFSGETKYAHESVVLS